MPKSWDCPAGVLIAMGTHDQCASAVGCGAIKTGQAMYGMGTFVCLTPVFDQRPAPERMISQGLNTEHHAVPGRYVSFIFNHGGSVVKWYRDTFAAQDKRLAQREGRDVYNDLFAEMPPGLSSILALPHFAPTGPPEFVDDSSAVLIGLKLATQRGDILKGLLEGITMYEREVLDALPGAGIDVDSCRAVGGGSKSDALAPTHGRHLRHPGRPPCGHRSRRPGRGDDRRRGRGRLVVATTRRSSRWSRSTAPSSRGWTSTRRTSRSTKSTGKSGR